MPKPLFLHRPAGLYVRFRVPADSLDVVGSRFLVRPLKMVKGDRARLVAESMAVALSQSFDSLRKGEGVDLKKALDAARGHGVSGFHIRKGKPGQKLKNKSSLRFIPIAQPLLDAGFMAFVEDMKAAGQERLLPHLPNTRRHRLWPPNESAVLHIHQSVGCYRPRYGVPRLPARHGNTARPGQRRPRDDCPYHRSRAVGRCPAEVLHRCTEVRSLPAKSGHPNLRTVVTHSKNGDA